MLAIAEILSRRGTCAKRKVGAVLIDKYNRIIGSGYSGTPRGMRHCTEYPCAGADAPRGSDLCQAVHGEANALLTCHDTYSIYKCYVTCAPCLRCTKTLLNTSCEEVIFFETPDEERPARELWLEAGRVWTPV